MGSDNERHDNIVKRIDDEESSSEEDLDKDLEGLIDNDEEIDEMGYLRVLDKVRKDFDKEDKKVTFQPPPITPIESNESDPKSL